MSLDVVLDCVYLVLLIFIYDVLVQDRVIEDRVDDKTTQPNILIMFRRYRRRIFILHNIGSIYGCFAES